MRLGEVRRDLDGSASACRAPRPTRSERRNALRCRHDTTLAPGAEQGEGVRQRAGAGGRHDALGATQRGIIQSFATLYSVFSLGFIHRYTSCYTTTYGHVYLYLL